MDTATEGTVRDPHHDGANEWKVEDRKLYHRQRGQSKWRQAKRVSFTPARILAIASLIERCFVCDGPYDDHHECEEWPDAEV